MTARFLARYVRFVLAHRGLFVFLVAVITASSLGVFTKAIVATSVEEMFFGKEHTEFQRYKELSRQFGSDEAVIVGIAADNPYAEPTLSKMRAAHKAAEQVPEVRRVFSPANFSRMGLVGDTIKERKFAEIAAADPTQADALFRELQADSEVGGLLVSKESGAFMLIASLETTDNRDAELAPLILEGIVDGFVDAGFDRDTIKLAGVTAVHSEIVHLSRDNLIRLFPAVVLILLVSVFLMFGRWWPVIVTSISALIAVIIAMAFSILRDPHINIMITLVPCLVMIISFSDVVHLCSAYLLELEDREDKSEAILAATIDVGQACLLTSLTTAVGFVSMMFIPTPVFIQLGAAAAFGVFAAYVVAMTLVPILLSVIETPHRWREGKNERLQKAIDHLLDACANLSIRHPYWVLLASLVAMVWCVVGAAQITFETEFMKRLGEDNPVRQDQRFFEREFASTTTLEVFVDSGEPEGMLDAKFFADLIAAQAALEALPKVEKVVSIVDIMRATHRSIAGPGAAFLPLSAEAIAQIFVVLEMQGIDALSPYVDFSRRSAHLTAYISEGGIRGIHELSLKFEETVKAILPSANVESTGFQALMGDWVSDIVNGQRRGLAFSLSVIALLLMIGFRSFRSGAVSMLPNILPLLALGGWVGWFWELVDTDTLIVAMIAIGIGVDDTIHFVSRYQIERVRQASVEDAIRATFHFSGRGIFMTTFIFTVGFLPFMASEYVTIAFMGYLLPYCFVVAVIADLLMVPALIRVGWIR